MEEVNSYSWDTNGKKCIAKTKYSLKAFRADSSKIDKEMNYIFENIYGTYKKSDKIYDKLSDLHIILDEALIVMDIEKRFEKFGVRLTDEQFNQMITFQDIIDEVKLQILSLPKQYRRKNDNKRTNI